MPKLPRLMKKRRDRVRRHLNAYKAEIYGAEQSAYEPDEQAIGDLLADLMHFAEIEGLDFEDAVRIARDHYEAERGPGDDIEQDSRRMEEASAD